MNLAKGTDRDSNSKSSLKRNAKHAAHSFGYRLVLPFIIPTARRWDREPGKHWGSDGLDGKKAQGPRKNTFLDDVIDDCAANIMLPIQVAAVIAQPVVVPFAVMTNMISYAYEKRGRQLRASSPQSGPGSEQTIDTVVVGENGSLQGMRISRRVGQDESQYPADLVQYEHPASTVQRKESSLSRLGFRIKNYFRQMPYRIKRSLRRMPRRIGTFLATYALVGSLCMGHYHLTKNSQPAGPVNVTATSCTLERKDSRHGFTILGEVHYYNKSSSEAAAKILEKTGTDVVLSEGTTREPNLEEKILFLGLQPFVLGLGTQEPTVSGKAIEKGIPVHYIEGRSKDGTRDGFAPHTNALITVMGVFGIVKAPLFYILGASMRHMGARLNYGESGNKVYEKVSQAAGAAMGVLGERNRLMTEAFVGYMESNPAKRPLLRMGEAHVPGVMELLRSYGTLTCKRISDEP